MSFIKAEAEVHAALDQAERCVAATGAALLKGLPEQVQSATQELHDSAHALALVLRGAEGGTALLVGAVRERLVRVARDIAMQREALLRRSAMVERSLSSLVPQPPAATYAGALGRYAGRAAASATFRSF